MHPDNIPSEFGNLAGIYQRQNAEYAEVLSSMVRNYNRLTKFAKQASKASNDEMVIAVNNDIAITAETGECIARLARAMVRNQLNGVSSPLVGHMSNVLTMLLDLDRMISVAIAAKERQQNHQ